jgi:hypothetical protein
VLKYACTSLSADAFEGRAKDVLASVRSSSLSVEFSVVEDL